MIGTVDFNMILELNHLLKKKGYDYSVQAVVLIWDVREKKVI